MRPGIWLLTEVRAQEAVAVVVAAPPPRGQLRRAARGGSAAHPDAGDAGPASAPNGFMPGHAMAWLIGGLAAIAIDFALSADHALRIEPPPVGDLSAAAATLASRWYMVRTRWRNRGDRDLGSGCHRFQWTLA